MDYKEINSLYKSIKKDLGIKDKTKKITAKDLETYRLVQELSGVPNKKRVEFWRGVMIQWNSGHPEDKYKTWKGIQIRYKRLMEKQSIKPENSLLENQKELRND